MLHRGINDDVYIFFFQNRAEDLDNFSLFFSAVRVFFNTRGTEKKNFLLSLVSLSRRQACTRYPKRARKGHKRRKYRKIFKRRNLESIDFSVMYIYNVYVYIFFSLFLRSVRFFIIAPWFLISEFLAFRGVSLFLHLTRSSRPGDLKRMYESNFCTVKVGKKLIRQ